MGNCVSSTTGINRVWFPLAIIYPRPPRLLMFVSFVLNVPAGLIKYKQRRGVIKPLVPSGHANSSMFWPKSYGPNACLPPRARTGSRLPAGPSPNGKE